VTSPRKPWNEILELPQIANAAGALVRCRQMLRFSAIKSKSLESRPPAESRRQTVHAADAGIACLSRPMTPLRASQRISKSVSACPCTRCVRSPYGLRRNSQLVAASRSHSQRQSPNTLQAACLLATVTWCDIAQGPGTSRLRRVTLAEVP
jgi:hypothetical protein